ncbi:SWIM zinc finger family protein [Streptomyces sviceus]|uniref:SWIM zinc finger family protein n=1 Tax=Streptomyces sviceus TaxID=285530 RepID=UPI0036B7BFC8
MVRTDAASGQLSCTCFWWAKYRGGRGPCKHVLAVGMARGTTPDTEADIDTDIDMGTEAAAANTARSETAR